MLLWIALFVAFDIVVTVLVLRRALARRAQLARPAPPLDATSPASPAVPGASPLLDLGKLRGFADAIHPRIGEYVRANWSGDPEALPGVLAAVVDMAVGEAGARGLGLDRTVLKRVVEHSIAAHKLAPGGVLREAMKRVA